MHLQSNISESKDLGMPLDLREIREFNKAVPVALDGLVMQQRCLGGSSGIKQP